LIARLAFNEVGGFDERLSGYEDDDLFLRLFRAGYGNAFIGAATTQWRLYAESASYTDRMRRSRTIYSRKLLQEFPDDVIRNRYPRRDVILPRFYKQAVFEYILAQRAKDPMRIAETRADLEFLCGQLPSGHGTTGKLLLRVPTLMKGAIAVRKMFRRVIGVVRRA
jgi:GT2 family glycosyltransferase